ncbi:MAG: hypothetical protein R3F62_04370 [Planctomycetota bacterium]
MRVEEFDRPLEVLRLERSTGFTEGLPSTRVTERSREGQHGRTQGPRPDL